jgi:hypothetical protein
MKNFVVYTSLGQIIKSGVCQDEVFDDQADAGCQVLEGIPAPNQYVSNGVLTNLPPKPDGTYIFDYVSLQWVPDQFQATSEVNSQRTALLYSSDWTQIPNNPLTTEQQQEWAVYRQQLRDIPQQSGYPYNVVWPTPPQG